MRKLPKLLQSTKPRSVSKEESELFRAAVGSVEPVKYAERTAHHNPPKVRIRERKGQDWSDLTPSDLPNLTSADVVGFATTGIQKRVLKRLRGGGFPIEGELDLHGLKVIEAKQRLAAYLGASVADGLRCLHIIHGKGFRSEGDHPALKNHLNLWLRQEPDVLAFCTAKPADGGTGALYVLLKTRRRKTDLELGEEAE